MPNWWKMGWITLTNQSLELYRIRRQLESYHSSMKVEIKYPIKVLLFRITSPLKKISKEHYHTLWANTMDLLVLICFGLAIEWNTLIVFNHYIYFLKLTVSRYIQYRLTVRIKVWNWNDRYRKNKSKDQ